MKEEWLLNGAAVPVDVETTAALVAEIHRLIGVVGGMALAQPEQADHIEDNLGMVPVAWLEPEWGEKICPEVGYEVTITDDHPRDLCWIPLYAHPPQGGKTKNIGCLGMPVNVPVTASKTTQKLVRIMGTFDLATGHADTFDELLDSLESELRDVLGHYREALSQTEQEPVAWQLWVGADTPLNAPMGWQFYSTYDSKKSAEVSARTINSYQQAPFAKLIPLYTTPPQRTWVGLTDDEKAYTNTDYAGRCAESWQGGVEWAESKLKERNT